MKKLLIALTVVAVAIVLSPMIGKSMIQTTLQDQISELENQGLEITNISETSSYFGTQSTYILKLKESDKFLEYIASHQKTQIPPYMKGILDGSELGVELDYSHIPLLKDVEIGIYPRVMPPQIAKDLKRNAPDLYDSLSAMMVNKQLYYQIFYTVYNDTFKGSIKDISQAELKIDENTYADITLTGASFDGSGTLIMPNDIKGAIKAFKIDIKEQNGMTFTVGMDGTSFDNKFKDLFDYASSFSSDSITLAFQEGNKQANFELKNSSFQTTSTSSTDKINGNTQTSVTQFSMNIPDGPAMSIDDIVLNVEGKDLDKAALEKLQVSVNNAQSSPNRNTQQALLEDAIKLLEKGFVLKIGELSVSNIKLASESIGGFRHTATLTIKPDPDLKNKMNNPILLAQNFNLDADLKFSKTLFDFILNNVPTAIMAAGFAKENGDNVEFKIVFDGQKLSVNGTPLM